VGILRHTLRFSGSGAFRKGDKQRFACFMAYVALALSDFMLDT
jgi:hypothetical protein